MKNTLGWVANPSSFLPAPPQLWCPIHVAASSRHGWDYTTAHTTCAAAILTQPERRPVEDIVFRVLAAEAEEDLAIPVPDPAIHRRAGE